MQVKKRKAAQAGLQKERMLLEKKIKKKRADADSAVRTSCKPMSLHSPPLVVCCSVRYSVCERLRPCISKLWRAQSPDTVKMREEMARLSRKLRTAEAELDTKRSQAQRQAANAEKLREQLREITSGA